MTRPDPEQPPRRMTLAATQEDPPAPPRLFVDVTTSWLPAEEVPFGLGNAERDMARRLLGSRDPYAIPVVFRDGRMFALPDDVLRTLWSPRVTMAEGRFRRDGIGMPAPPGHGHARGSPSQAELPAISGLGHLSRSAARALLARLPDAIREDARLAMIHLGQVGRTLTGKRQALAPHEGGRPAGASPQVTRVSALRAVVHPQPGDILFTAGSPACLPLRAVAELRRATGLRVACLCYAVPRLRHRGSAAEATPLLPEAGDAMAMLDAADVIWTVSSWAAQEWRSFATENGRSPPQVEVIRLGPDGASMARPALEVDARDAALLPSALAGRRFALAVDPVCADGNIGLLLRCWQRLVEADTGWPLDLVILGRPGPGAADCVRQIEGSPLVNAHVFRLDVGPGASLAGLYAACHLVLHPALADGWCLPVREALAHGREVIAAASGAIPEIAQGSATLLDPCDDAAWLAAIRAAASRPRREVPPQPPPCWDSAAETVLARLRQPARPADATGA
jgi:glycosyltransferase involved in cell wall biosynthesis